jgi:two-component system KDP operon response regulator KdpE
MDLQIPAGVQEDSPVPDPEEQGLDLDRVRAGQERRLALIIDDDADTVQLLKLSLQREGLNVIGALDGYEAVSKCMETNPDVILLDLMMPELDGWETMAQLREISMAPVVVISALNHADHVVRALSEGAEDYIRKPFSGKEVVARVQAAIRRGRDSEPAKVLALPKAGLLIDLETHQVRLHNQVVKLTQYEFSILTQLSLQVPRPVSYQQLTEAIWGEHTPQSQKRLKWVIHQLRKKLVDRQADPDVIVNFRNYGYQLQP